MKQANSFKALACLSTLLLLAMPTFAEQAPVNPAPSIEEIIVTGTSLQDKMEMDEDTEKLFSIAGAAFDPLQAIYSMPGVTFSAGGQPVIRGSSPSDNVFYIDLVPANYIFHVFGNSIFNKNLIHSFDLYPAAFPSRYGHATGGVLDVSLREPRNQPFTTTLSWSFLLLSAMVESRLSENQAFYASYRRSQVDIIFDEKDIDKKDGVSVEKLPASDDYQIKYAWHVDDHNQLSFLAAGANDSVKASFDEEANMVERDPDNQGPANFSKGFDSQGLIWQWQSKNGLSAVSTRVTHLSDYFNLRYGVGQFMKTRANRMLARVDYSQQWEDHQITIGASGENSRYQVDYYAKIVPCSEFDADCPTLDAVFVSLKDKVSINTYAVYIEDSFPLLSDKHWLTLGLHYTQDDYLQAKRSEPRLRWEYFFADNWTTHIALGRYSRLPELRRMLGTIGNPKLKTLKADHYVWGIEQHINSVWSWKVDLYYKDLQDVVISVSDPSDPDFGKNYNNNAKGEAYGVELLLNKNLSEQWYGWVAVSVGKAKRTNLRSYETKPFDYDRPIIVDVVFNYLLTEHWTLGAKWSLQSGGMYTPIIAVQANANQPTVDEPVYGEYNSRRLPYYHRLDFLAEYKRDTRFGYWSFYIDILNVYNRHNVNGYSYAANGKNTLSSNPPGFGDDVPVSAQTTMGILPSIGFEIQF